MKSKRTKINNMKEVLRTPWFIIMTVIIICYLVIYYLVVYPMHDLSKYQDKAWIKKITEDLIVGISDPERLKKVRNYEKNILSFWYSYWYFHTKQYTIWAAIHIRNKFSNKATIRIYYYDFLNKEHKNSNIDIDFREVKTFILDDKIIIQHPHYLQEINMNNDTMRITIDTEQIQLKFDLSIEDYSTNMPTLIPRYKMFKPILDFRETKCPNEWGSDNPMIGKIINGSINHSSIEPGGNFWFDNMLGFNNYFLSEYVWFVILNDDWLIYILLNDTIDHIKEKKNNMITVLLIKDRKKNKMLVCGMDTNVCTPFYAIDKLVQPKKVDCNYVNKEEFDVHYEMPNFKVDIVSKPNEVSRQSKMVVNDYYHSDIDTEKLSEFDKKYYNTIKGFHYVEMVTIADVTIQYNNEKTQFTERVIVDGFEYNGKKEDQHIFCENQSKMRDYFIW